MFDFLWHLRGSVPLDRCVTNQAAFASVEQLLVNQRKPISDLSEEIVAFDSPLWTDGFGPNWLAMSLYDQGRFWIDQGLDGPTLRYDLRSLHGLLFCLGGAVLFFSIGLADGGLIGGLKLGVFALGWLYGMNMLLAFTRIPRLIRKAARDA